MSGLEPLTSCVQGRRSSQLSYTPTVVRLTTEARFFRAETLLFPCGPSELLTDFAGDHTRPLKTIQSSNLLDKRPCWRKIFAFFLTSNSPKDQPKSTLGLSSCSRTTFLPRKEVIQPHLPIRLPCYDLTPVIKLTFGGSSPTSGTPNSRGLTGGVYKARERIHRDMLIRDY